MTDRFIDEYASLGCPGVHCLPVPQTNGECRVIRYFKEDWFEAWRIVSALTKCGMVSRRRCLLATRCIMDLASRDGVLEQVPHRRSILEDVVGWILGSKR